MIVLAWICAGLIAVVLSLLLFMCLAAWRSRPRLNGTIAVRGLGAATRILRDGKGVPTIRAADRRDAAYATGFLHAQERFFQMDLSRRIGAGELAALFGSKLIPIDRTLRVHQFRKRTRRALESLDPEDRELLRSYSAGVNAGLAAFPGRPFEYFVTLSHPEPWQEEDSLLVAYSLYILLQDGQGDQKYHLRSLFETLPREVAEFLAVPGDETWDAPMRGGAIPTPPTPGLEVFSLRDLAPGAGPWECEPVLKGMINGSNCWVVSGAHTVHGAPMVANDMHLGFAMPTPFFRASIEHGAERLTGFTLPGFPLMVTGSNGRIAWGLTNSAADWVDLIQLSASTTVTSEVEMIRAKGGRAERFEILHSTHGPAIRIGPTGERFAERWVAHQDGAVNLGLRRVEGAATVGEALAFAPQCGMPAQNFHVADSLGNIGWTIAGRIPRRSVYSRLPLQESAAGEWQGWLTAEEYPAIVNPPSGKLWSANARTVCGADLEKLGFGFYISGARAHQIRENLETLERASEEDLLRLQLDDRAVFLTRWRGLLLGVLDDSITIEPEVDDSLRHNKRLALRKCVENWSGRASASCAGYRAVRAFRYAVKGIVLAAFIDRVRRDFPDFNFDEVGDQWEAPLWRIVSERPEHLLPQPFKNWEECLVAAADGVVEHLGAGDKALEARCWGEINMLQMRHPFSMVLPLAGRWLNMHPQPLNGDLNMPLSQIGVHGPVQRMVVSPGRETNGIAHLAGGQAGNPLAPYFGAGHQDWLSGKPAPFLPGAACYDLQLRPEAN